MNNIIRYTIGNVIAILLSIYIAMDYNILFGLIVYFGLAFLIDIRFELMTLNSTLKENLNKENKE